ncbi:MAG: iron chaperone [Saccharofermentanales bacterium]
MNRKDKKTETDVGRITGYTTIDEYINQFPPDIQDKLNKLRQVIREAAPEAAEKISYAMPTFFYKKNLVHFAAYTKHIGFYPTPSGTDKFKEELSRYKVSKGAIQFPVDEPLPYDLIARIVRFRVEEHREMK